MNDNRVLMTEEIRQKRPGREEFKKLRRMPVTIILDNLHNTANIGNIFRIADAFLLEKVYIYGSNVINGRKFKRISKNIQKWVPHENVNDLEEVLSALKRKGYTISGVDLCTKSQSLEKFTPVFPLALVFGSEVDGLS